MKRSWGRFNSVLATLATLCVSTGSAVAQGVVVDFESPAYAAASVLGQEGWVTTSYAATPNGTLTVSSASPLAGGQSLSYSRTDPNLGPFNAADVAKADIVTVAKDGTAAADLNVSFLMSSSSLATQGFGYGVTGLFLSPDGPGGMSPMGMRLNNAGSSIPSLELFGNIGGALGWHYFGGSLAAAAFPADDTLEFKVDVDFDSQSYAIAYRNATAGGAFTAPQGPIGFHDPFPADPNGHYTIDVIASFRFGAGKIDNLAFDGNLIPEPTTACLGLFGLGALAFIRRKQ